MSARLIGNNTYVHTEEHGNWPAPFSGEGSAMGDLNHKLRYSAHEYITREDLLYAASIISAYRELINMPARERASIIADIRSALAKDGGKP